jgi:hypothetical protein
MHKPIARGLHIRPQLLGANKPLKVVNGQPEHIRENADLVVWHWQASTSSIFSSSATSALLSNKLSKVSMTVAVPLTANRR